MTTEIQTQITDLAPASTPAATPAPAEQSEGFDLYAFVHRALRGQYVLAAWLGIVGAIAGAIAGYALTKPLYKSEGLLRIAYALPTVLRETDQNQPMAMYDSFLRSQQMRMSSRSLVEQALKSSEWQSRGGKVNADVIAWFADGLAIEHPAGTEHIRVTFTDPDPLTAAAAVRAVISTYTAAYSESDVALHKQRMRVLDERRKALSTELSTIGTRVDQLALMDSMLAEYLKRQAALETELKTLEVQGYLPNHRRVMELRSMLDRTSAMIREYSEMAQRLHDLDTEYSVVTDKPAAIPGTQGGPIVLDAKMWEGDNRTRRDIISVGAGLVQLQRLQANSETIRKELMDTTQRMDALKMEAGLGGRLEVISSGDAPLAPFKDKRKLYAGAGAMAGASLPWFILAALGALYPKYRRADDPGADLGDRLPLLGTVPALTNRTSDLILAAGAAQSIHQMRVRMQRMCENEDRRVFLLTSPCAGEGKTSIVTSLGMSFAASGCKTLLIDFDMVGRRLTRGFRSERRDGAFEALNGADINHCIHEAAPGLSLMPAGKVDPQQACTLSGHAVAELLREVRDQYDVVLLDSGPALGSVETSLATPRVDGVVLTVSRGQQPARVEQSLRHLESLGARMAGMIFNRAEPRQFAKSSYHSSFSSVPYDRQRMGPEGMKTQRSHGEAPMKSDVMVRSVMTFLPLADETNHPGHPHTALIAPSKSDSLDTAGTQIIPAM